MADAKVHVWHASTEGFYENRDPGQADMNLRGIFTTDQQGHVWFRSSLEHGTPIDPGRADRWLHGLMPAESGCDVRSAFVHERTNTLLASFRSNR